MGKNPPARAGDAARSLAAAKPVRHDDRGLKPAAWHSARAEATREACPLQRESPSGREGPAQPQQSAVPPARAHFPPRAAPTSAPRSNPASLPGSSPTRWPPRMLLTQDLTRAVPTVWMVLLDPVDFPPRTPQFLLTRHPLGTPPLTTLSKTALPPY